MDVCKKCGAPAEVGEEFCADCKSAQEQPAQAAQDIAAAGEPKTGQQEPPAEQEPETEQIPPASRKKPASEKKARLRSQLLMGGVLLVAAIAVCLVVYVTKGRPTPPDTGADAGTAEPSLSDQTTGSGSAAGDSTTDDGQTGADANAQTETVEFVSFTKDPAEVTDEEKFAVVATCAGEELTNQMLAYYYWYAYNTYYNYLSYYGVIDASLPLDEQACYFDSSISWQEYFVNSGVAAFTQFTLLCKQAEEAGFVLGAQAQETLDTLEQSLQEAADEGGFASIDAYLQEYYGAFADYESYRQFMETYSYSLEYDDSIYTGFNFTDDEVSAYYDEHADEIGVEKDDSLMVDVRHVLIAPETVEDVLDADGNVDETATAAAQEAAMEAAKAEAEALYAEWQAGEATEDTFSDLAYNHSTDPGSFSNGGLYEDVYPGEMIAEFNDWCFDPSRQPGDTGIVETSYGYHIMYFSAYGETSYWRSLAISAMVEEAYADFFEGVMEHDDTVSNTELVVLLDPPFMTAEEETTHTEDTAAETAAGAGDTTTTEDTTDSE